MTGTPTTPPAIPGDTEYARSLNSSLVCEISGQGDNTASTSTLANAEPDQPNTANPSETTKTAAKRLHRIENTDNSKTTR